MHGLAAAGLNLQFAPAPTAVTAVFSNLVSNSATVMLLLKVANVTQPPGAYVLALANSFGGSLIIVGSVANIIAVQQARRSESTSRSGLARLGVPVTLAALAGLVAWAMVMS